MGELRVNGRASGLRSGEERVWWALRLNSGSYKPRWRREGMHGEQRRVGLDWKDVERVESRESSPESVAKRIQWANFQEQTDVALSYQPPAPSRRS
jgi:hypothetical protein